MAPVQPPAFGELLKRHRSAAGLTQEALAERASMSARGISDLERGVRRLPRKDTVGLLADALGLAAPERTAFAAAARRLGDAASSPPPFVGRARELALLERHLAGRGPSVLLLAGEPGIGKTRLLREAAQRGPGQGWRVLWRAAASGAAARSRTRLCCRHWSATSTTALQHRW